MRLYIAGPMTGLPDYNFPAFNDAAEKLRAVGYDVANPADHGQGMRPWKWYMRRALKALLDCDAVALLPGYTNSKGATLETEVAEALEMPTRYIEVWIKEVDRWTH